MSIYINKIIHKEDVKWLLIIKKAFLYMDLMIKKN